MDSNYFVNSISQRDGRYWLRFLLNGGLLIKEYRSCQYTNGGGVVPYAQATMVMLFEQGLVREIRGRSYDYLAPSRKVLDQEESVSWWVA